MDGLLTPDLVETGPKTFERRMPRYIVVGHNGELSILNTSKDLLTLDAESVKHLIKGHVLKFIPRGITVIEDE